MNNAGISVVSIFEATPMEVIRSLFETNVLGVINVTRAITPYFRTQGGGTIVNVSSGVGFASSPLLSYLYRNQACCCRAVGIVIVRAGIPEDCG